MPRQKPIPVVPDEMYDAGSSSSSTALLAPDVFEHPQKDPRRWPCQCRACGRQYQSPDAAKTHYVNKHNGHRPVPDDMIIWLNENAPYRAIKKRRYSRTRAEDLSHDSSTPDPPETRNRAQYNPSEMQNRALPDLDLNPAADFRSNAPSLLRPRSGKTVLGKRTFTQLQASDFQSQFAQSYIQNRAPARQYLAKMPNRSGYMPFHTGLSNNTWQAAMGTPHDLTAYQDALGIPMTTGTPTSDFTFSQNVQGMGGLTSGFSGELDHSLTALQTPLQDFSGQTPLQGVDASDPSSEYTNDLSNDASESQLYGLGLNLGSSFNETLAGRIQNDEVIFPQSDSTNTSTQQYGSQLFQTNMQQDPQDLQSAFGYGEQPADAGVNNAWDQIAQQDVIDAQLYLDHGPQLPVTDSNDAWTQTEVDPAIDQLLQESRDLRAQLVKVQAERDGLKAVTEQTTMFVPRKTPINPQMPPLFSQTIDSTQLTTPIMPQTTAFAPQRTLAMPQTALNTPQAAYPLPQTTAFARRAPPLHKWMRPSAQGTPYVSHEQEQSSRAGVDFSPVPGSRHTPHTVGSGQDMRPSSNKPQPSGESEPQRKRYPFLDMLVQRGEVSGPAIKRKPSSFPLAEHMPLPPGVLELNPLPRPPSRSLYPSSTRPSSQSGSSNTAITQETRATRPRREVEAPQPNIIVVGPGRMSRVSNNNTPYEKNGESYRLSGRRRERWDIYEGDWVKDPAPRKHRRQ